MYVKSHDDLLGKSKVAPQHGHTIRRLELCAAVLAVEIGEILSEELSLPKETIKYFTDSKVVLGYLENKTRRFYVYVEHRVSRILQYSNAKQWFYIPTDMNPADHGTRYMLPSSLNASFWLSNQIFEGINMNGTSSQNFPLINPDTDEEIRPQAKTCKTAVKTIPTLGTDRFSRFSDWNKLVKIISLLQHIAKGCKLKFSEHSYHKGWHYCHSYKTVESRNQASNFIIKQFQQSAYCKEIQYVTEEKQLPRDSSVLVLSPFLDKDGILRVGGRLKNMYLPYPEKHRILIPGHCHLATLLVRHCHQSIFHQGRHFTEGAVRNAGYWIIGSKRLINYIIHKCVQCRKLRGKLAYQKMSDLPDDRFACAPPFSFVGVDVFGPWNIVARRTRGEMAAFKRWAVLFACQAKRAISSLRR